MSVISRLADARHTIEGKIVSVLLSILLVVGFLNLGVFTDQAVADGSDAEAAQTEEPATQPEVTETESGSDEGTTEVTENEDEGTTEDTEEVPSDEVTDEDEALTEETEDEELTEEEVTEEDIMTASEVPATWDATSSTLTIENVDGLDKAAVEEYLDGLTDENGDRISVAKTDVKHLVLNNVGDINRPNGVSAFDGFGGSVVSLTINGAGDIAGYSFYMWSQLEEVNITNTASVGERAFFKCPKLAAVTLKTVSTINSNGFAESKAIESVVLDEIGFVGAEAFRQCSALTNLRMSNIDAFDRSPFSYCTGLTTIDIDGEASGIKSLGTTMFYHCTGIENVSIKNIGSTGLQVFNGCTGITTANLESVGTVTTQAFYGCSSLDSVTMKDVETIEAGILQDCNNVETLTLEDVDTIGEQAFVSAGVASVAINDCGTIGKNAFASSKVQTVNINGVDTIGQYAFYNCTGLKTVEMDAVRFIDNYAFWGCKNLTTIDSLKNVTERINGFAFYGCKSLTGWTVADLTKMGFIGNSQNISQAVKDRVTAILQGTFHIDDAEEAKALELNMDEWTVGALDQSANWQAYDHGTQITQQARWSASDPTTAEVKVDAYYTSEKQTDYIFVADLSGSMAQLGNPDDSNARFYDMQSKLLEMTGKLLGTPGYDCRVAIVTFGGEYSGNATVKTLPFTKDAEEVSKHIWSLEPLNENTDYGLGMKAALDIVNNQLDGRNAAVVFLSDGAPNVGNSGDQYGTKTAGKIKEKDVPIYGILHSPTASSSGKAEAAMKGICGDENLSVSTDTISFGKAMDTAFTAIHGNNTVTIPVNAEDFDVVVNEPSAGTAKYDPEAKAIIWTLNGMPFTDHTLTYNLVLKEDRANRIGTYSYAINNGDATFGEGKASVGIDLTLSRTVNDPDDQGSGTGDPVVPTNPATPGGTDAGTGAGTGAGAGAGAGAAAPATAAAVDAAPVTEAIADDATPMAQAAAAQLPEAGEQEITDNENPLGVFDQPVCTSHWWMLMGIVLTVIYGAAVALRRISYARRMDDFEDDVLGVTPEAQKSTATGHVAQGA